MTLLASALLVIVMTLGAGLSSVAQAKPARVAAGGDAMALSMANGTTDFQYDPMLTPHLIAVVTLSAPIPPNTPNDWDLPAITLNGSKFTNIMWDSYPTSDPLTYTVNVWLMSQWSLESYTVTESLTLPDGQFVQSNAITFTVSKGTAQFTCPSDVSQAWGAAGRPIKLKPDFGAYNISPVGWGGTFTVTFKGPTTTTESDLRTDSAGRLTATAPTELGQYDVTCTFSGNSLYNPSTATATTWIGVSDMRTIGGVSLYSNPTTFTTNTPMTFYVVVHSRRGLPTPTGSIDVAIGAGFTQSAQLGPGGDAIVHINPTSTFIGVTEIDITYSGDEHYAQLDLGFHLTNPAIPGSAAAAGGSGSGSQPTASPASTVTGSRTASPSTTPVDTGTAPMSSVRAPEGSSAVGWLAALGGVIALGGGSAGFLVWQRKRRPATAPSEVMSQPGGSQYPSDARFPGESRYPSEQWPPYVPPRQE